MKSKFLTLGLFVVVVALIGVLGVRMNYIKGIKDIEVKATTTVILEDDYIKNWRIVKNEDGSFVAIGNVFGNGEAKKYLDDTTIQIEYKTVNGNGDVTTEIVVVPVTVQERNNVEIKLPIEHYDRIAIK